VIVLGGIVATQSRFPLLMCVAMTPVTLVVARRVTRQWTSSRSETPPAPLPAGFSPWRRGLALLGILTLTGCGTILFRPDYFAGLAWRFSQITSLAPTGTLQLRMALWGFAWKAFVAHPLTGIGPGAFRYISEIMPETRLDSVAYWIRGLSAHNLMLHYLAESGLLGAAALLVLMIRQFGYGRRLLRVRASLPLTSADLCLALLAGLFLVTTFLETGWLWGQTGFVFAFTLGLIARRNAAVDRALTDAEQPSCRRPGA